MTNTAKKLAEPDVILDKKVYGHHVTFDSVPNGGGIVLVYILDGKQISREDLKMVLGLQGYEDWKD